MNQMSKIGPCKRQRCVDAQKEFTRVKDLNLYLEKELGI